MWQVAFTLPHFFRCGFQFFSLILKATWRIPKIYGQRELVLSYILPLSAFDFTEWDQVVLFLIFFVTLGFLCIRHNHFSFNIWLEILNYKVFTCELEDEDKNVVQRKIISHRTLNTHKGEYIFLKSLNNEIKLDIED